VKTSSVIEFHFMSTDAFVNEYNNLLLHSPINMALKFVLVFDCRRSWMFCFQYGWREDGGLHVKFDTNEVSLWSAHARRTMLSPDPCPWTQRYYI